MVPETSLQICPGYTQEFCARRCGPSLPDGQTEHRETESAAEELLQRPGGQDWQASWQVDPLALGFVGVDLLLFTCSVVSPTLAWCEGRHKEPLDEHLQRLNIWKSCYCNKRVTSK